MAKKGLLLIISGPSGVGKGTVCTRLIAKHPEISHSISATTRPKRDGELDGIHYYFMSEEDFHKGIDFGEFLEWAKVYNHYYGTRKEAVDDILAAGQDVILEIDINGAKQVKSQLPEAILIFIMPPNKEELAQRLRGRGTDSPEVIEARLNCFEAELKEIGCYDYVVFNNEVEDAVKQVEVIIQAEKSRVSHLYDDILNIL